MYRTGDFVMLKNINDHKVERTWNPTLNIFEILDILPDGFNLRYIDRVVTKDDVLPIPINGKDERWIYYDPVIAAAVVRPEDTAPVHSTDYTYYFDAFARSHTENGKTFQEIIREKGLQFVHEIQHYLSDKYHHCDLKINDLRF